MSSPRTAFAAGLAAAIALPLALVGGAAAHAETLSPPGTVLNGFACPDLVAKLATPFEAETWDSDNTSVTPTVAAGALPPGLVFGANVYGGYVKGTPTQLGHYTFTLRAEDQYGRFETQSCYMDVVPANSTIERIGAADRYAEAVDIAYEVIGNDPVPLVYVASGENFADALSASAIAAQHHAPIILSTHDSLPVRASSFIAGRAPADIVVIGSENTLSGSVVDQIEAASGKSTITRIGGVDRYETSRMLISDPKFGAKASTEVFVASGTKFPDALSASPAAATVPAPVLLVNGTASGLTAPEKALLTSRGVKTATVFGGEDTLSAGLKNDLAATTGSATRIDGVDRYAVSAHTVAKYFPAATPSDTVYLATGANFPDALAGGALAGAKHAPILLVSKSCMTAEVAAEITRLKPQHLVLLGGPNTLDATLGTLPLCS